MHTGYISFCDRIANNIKSSDTKEEILRELQARYEVQILHKHWQKLDAEGVTHLNRSPHFACLRSNGNPYYMYFTRYEDVPIVYYVDKKIQPGYQVPRIILGKGTWSPSLFQGTLMEGEMVKDRHGGWIFLVNDVIAYEGEYLWKLILPQRLEYGYKILSEHYAPNRYLDVCKFQIKRYAHATQDGVSLLQDMAEELPYTTRGLYLWPFSRKFKPKLYNFDDSLVKAVTRKVKDNPEFREMDAVTIAPSHTQAPCEQDRSLTMHVELAVPGTDEKIYWLRKTENPDVYDLYTSVQCTHKEGVAYVPSLQTSKLLRGVFKDVTVAMSVPFVCTYDSLFSKWKPTRQANK